MSPWHYSATTTSLENQKISKIRQREALSHTYLADQDRNNFEKADDVLTGYADLLSP